MEITANTAEELRRRAASLRAAARALDHTIAIDLHRRAGPDTWVGPTPSACYDMLVSGRRSLANAAAELRLAARALERWAEQADMVNRR